MISDVIRKGIRKAERELKTSDMSEEVSFVIILMLGFYHNFFFYFIFWPDKLSLLRSLPVIGTFLGFVGIPSPRRKISISSGGAIIDSNKSSATHQHVERGGRGEHDDNDVRTVSPSVALLDDEVNAAQTDGDRNHSSSSTASSSTVLNSNLAFTLSGGLTNVSFSSVTRVN